MRLLLDTHAFLWFIDDDSRMGVAGREAVKSVANEVFLSIASVWEIAIKTALGKLPLQQPLVAFIEEETAKNSIQLLSITPIHLERIVLLPMHHRDPFDRLLVAQCQIERMSIVSADQAIARYAVESVW